MYVDPITRQTYDYAPPITCDNIPRRILNLIPIRMTKTGPTLDLNQLKEYHKFCFHLLKSKLQ